MSEKVEAEGREDAAIVEGEVGDVSAESVTIASGAAQSVEAQTVTVEEGGLGDVRADSVQVRQGGIGKAEAASVQVEQGGIGLVKAESVTVSDGGVFGVYAGTAHLEGTNVALLAAKNVSGEARVLLDWRAAAVFGAALGLVLGLLCMLRRVTEDED